MVKKDLHASLPRGCLQRAHEADPSELGFLDGGVRRLAGLNYGPCHDGYVVGPGHRGAGRLRTAPVGRPIHKNYATVQEKVVDQDVVVGESANDVAVVEAEVGGAVGLHQRPVGEVLEEDIRRIHYSRLFLGPRAAAQRDISGADDGVAPDVPVGLYQDYRRVVLHGCNGGGQPGSSGPDHHDVRFSIPLAHSRGGPCSGRQTGQGRALQE